MFLFPVWLDRIYDFIFPKAISCYFCGCDLDSGQICDECQQKLKALKVDNQTKKNLKSKSEINALSCYYYEDIIRDIIISYKYDRNLPLYLPMARHILKVIEENNISFDLITYVPLHVRKRRHRGFDQSKRLAIGLSYLSGKSYIKTLKRVKNTKTQASLDQESREQNVKNAFELKIDKNLSGKSVIIIDDVTTTGATLHACIKKLEHTGAKKIIPITFSTTKFEH